MFRLVHVSLKIRQPFILNMFCEQRRSISWFECDSFIINGLLDQPVIVYIRDPNSDRATGCSASKTTGRAYSRKAFGSTGYIRQEREWTES